MKKFFPYNIVHIDLSEELEFLCPDTDEKGSYTVLWWKEIALGSFFLEPAEPVPENEYHDKIITAILPVIRFYESKSQAGAACDWDEFSLTSDIPVWKSRLETVFAPWITDNLPEIVPISVIICTRNRPEFLYRCLNRLMASTPRPQEILGNQIL